MTSPAPAVRVWIVEDHDTFRRSLERLCTPEHGLAPPHSFTNGVSMMTALHATSPEELPEVMLLDLGLPGRSGLELIAAIHHAAPECRIVILTVFEDETKISQAISKGACGYLVKTTHAEDIVRAIHEAHLGGSPMSPKIAASVVKMLAKLIPPAATPISLSPREHELLGLLVEGLTAKEIAERLGVSIHTTSSHTKNLFAKLDVHNRAAAVARALKERLI